MKSFSKWTIAEVEKEFKIQRVLKSSLLDEWLIVQSQPTDIEQQLIVHLRENLEERIYAWNEHELKANFIAPFLSLIDFESEHYHVFAERELAAPYNDTRIWGDVDFLVSQGVYAPERPFFFLHEYKREDESSSSPLGQLMIAMVAAQILNQDDAPLYGVYIRGRHWHFTILHKKEYIVNSGFNALKDDEIFDIFGVLKNTKAIIDQSVSQRRGH